MSKRLKFYALFSKRAKDQLNNEKEQAQLQRTASQSSYMNQRRKIFINMDPYMEDDDHMSNTSGYSHSNKNNGDQIFNTNRIRTSKYTPLTFIPKNLFEQFRNVANLYFLFLVVLQCIPLFGVVEPAVSALPLIAILLITAIKDGVEDFKRNQSDDRVNGSKTRTLCNWENVNLPPEPNGFLFTYHAFLGFFCMLAGVENRYSHAYRMSILKKAPLIKANHHDHMNQQHHHSNNNNNNDTNNNNNNISNSSNNDNNENNNNNSRRRPHSLRRPSSLATQEGGQPVLIDDYPLSQRYSSSITSSTSRTHLPQYLELPPSLTQHHKQSFTPKKILSTVRQRSDTLKSELSNIFKPHNENDATAMNDHDNNSMKKKKEKSFLSTWCYTTFCII
ncbi:unnamed protein product [Cunninghamella echinulata]